MAPYRQRSVYEVHSDVSFYELNDGEPMEFRRTPRRAERSAGRSSR